MLITTQEILDKLAIEKEENAFISKQLLNETNIWISKFASYPDITFEFTGEYEPFLKYLESNSEVIEAAVHAALYGKKEISAATEEEAGVIEGFTMIDPEESPISKLIPGIKRGPTLTISYDELFDMFTHMKGIVDGHTDTIDKLERLIAENAEKATVIPAQIELLTPQIMHCEPEIESFSDDIPPPPLLYGEEVEDLQLSDIHPEPETHNEPDEYIEEIEPHNEHDNFSEFNDPASAKETLAVKKPKFDTKKKIVIAAIMVVTFAGMGAAFYFMPSHNKTDNESQMKPPTSLNAAPAALPPAQAQAPQTFSNNSSNQKQPNAQSQQQSQPIVAQVEPATKETTKAISEQYYDNMKVYVKTGNKNTIYLNKGEQVKEIQGQDTDNWSFNYKPENNTIMFFTKTNKLRNTIIIKTNKKNYTIKLVSSNKGGEQINLAPAN